MNIQILPDQAQHDAQVDALYARAFGPGRFAKAAARLRENNVCQRDCSFVAMDGDTIVGACRLWPIQGTNGAKALFLGPIAVDHNVRNARLGQRLIDTCLGAHTGTAPIFLVGDLPYFSRMGFEVVPAGQVKMPGPVDPKRLLWRKGTSDPATWPTGLLSPFAPPRTKA